ncbi:unnamed protein product [Paramecium sonneborni]|uniref:Uncharacterized protein n=1 Tax=Paramecium sonneborni TaxID=65129 RepID=A0A8S1JZC6_9CILI|nr:unnamed protein product [Paramecium sonneborni]
MDSIWRILNYGSLCFFKRIYGSKNSLKTYAESIEFIQTKRYQQGFRWTANDISINLYDKLHLILRENQSLQNLYVEEIKSYLYDQLNSNQVLYISKVDKSIIKLKNILNELLIQ